MNNNNIAELQEFISKINWENEEAYDILFNALIYKFAIPLLFAPLKVQSSIFRSRPNIKGLDYILFKELSYPQSEDVKNYARANKPGQQVFYASDNFITNFAEQMPLWLNNIAVDETFAVTTGQWQLNSDVLVAIIPDLTNEILTKFLESSPDLELNTFESDYWNFINSFFSVQGFNNPNIYKFTSAFCNALVHKSKLSGMEVEGILYTSVQDSSGWNLALSPNVADTKLVLKRIVKHFIHKREQNNGKPVYDNFEPNVLPKKLDYASRTIHWEE